MNDATNEASVTGIERAKQRRAARDASGQVYVDGSIYEGMAACLVRSGKTIAHVVDYSDAVAIAAALASAPAELTFLRQFYDDWKTGKPDSHLRDACDAFEDAGGVITEPASAPAGDGVEAIEKLIREHFQGAVIHDDYRENGHAMRDEIDACEGVGDLARQIAALARPRAAVETVDCERCCGNGEVVTDWDRYKHPHDGDKGDEAVADCPDCGGTGKVDSPRAAVGERPSDHDIGIVLAWAMTGNAAGYGTGLLRPIIEKLCRLALQAPPAKVEPCACERAAARGTPMTCLTCERTGQPSTQQEPYDRYKIPYDEFYERMKWIQGNPKTRRGNLGRHVADIANDLIRAAYPDLGVPEVSGKER